MKLSAIAARVFARLLDDHVQEGTATVGNGQLELVVTFRAIVDDEEGLKAVHRKLLKALTQEPKTATKLCRESGYSPSSIGAVRQGLADLVRMGRAIHTPDGYSLARR